MSQSVVLSLHLDMVHMPLQQGLIFYIPFESNCCLFVAYCHEFRNSQSYDWFVLPVKKKNFKNPLLHSLITQRSFENLSYLSSCSLSQGWRFQRLLSNLLRDIESYLAYTKVSRAVSQYILWFGSLWQRLSGRILKNKRIFFISNFKTNVCFLNMTVQLGVANNHIN